MENFREKKHESEGE